ncbi:MAG: hypothetical protein FWE88_08085 [Phycisphaerae bacterium]|nr:hypothetical protein [Phycisphaerae bacterium]
MGIGIFLAAVLVAVVAGPLTVLRAGETTTQPTTQPARKDQPSAATQPAAGKQDEAGQLPQLRFLMWQEEDETSRENPTVWAPDGESVKDETDLKVLQQINVGTMGGGPDETWRYLFLFFSHPDIDHSTIIRVAIVDADGIEIIGSGSQNYSLHPRGERGNPDDSGWAVVVRSPGKIEDEIPKSVDIMLRYSLRPWEEVGTLGGVFESPATVDDITVEKAEEITVDQAHVDLTGDGKVGDVRTKLHVIRDLDIARRMQFDIVAVMLDGREVIRSKRSLIRSGPGGVEKVCFWFDAPQSDIKLFKFCVRPIRVVTFKNVSLEPGTITKPTVVGDPPPAATPVKNPATKPAAK